MSDRWGWVDNARELTQGAQGKLQVWGQGDEEAFRFGLAKWHVKEC